MSTHLNVPIQINGGQNPPINDSGQSNFKLFDREPYVLQNNDAAYLFVGVPQGSIDNNYEIDGPLSKPVPVYTEFANKAGMIERLGYFRFFDTSEETEGTQSYIGNFNITSNGLHGISNEKPSIISDFNAEGLKKLVIDIESNDICGTDPLKVENPELGQIFFKIIENVI